MSTSKAHWAFLIPSLLLYFLDVASASLPYNPTHLFPSRDGSDGVYLIQPTAPNSYQYEISLIKPNSGSSNALSRKHISSSLPFVEEDQPIAFTPIIDDEGDIFVYAGNCTAGSAGSSIWRFSSEDEENEPEGRWRQQIVHHNEQSENVNFTGANFLAAGIYYNPSTNDEDASNSSLYVFGGMCPNTSDIKSPWTSENYSNVMLRFDTSQLKEESSKFDLDLVETNDPPTAEAGFTITPLQATYTNATEGTQSKQQDFLLIGGQTESAFINMSQVALFSLPQESWTFLPVLQPSEIENDVGEKSAIIQTEIEVEPRIGHSAVLSRDGKQVVIYGGWVGDINTPAQPQLALLEVGSGYGGDGEWAWKIPRSNGLNIADKDGLYGHGATVLPGNILMIAGGYKIQSGTSKRKRADLSLNDDLLFYNISSYTWLEDYPSFSVEHAKAKTDGPLSSASQKIGLSAGLVIAFTILALILIFFWRRRKYRKSNAIREKNIRQLSLETNESSLTNREPRSWFSNIRSRLHSIAHRRHSLLPTDESSWQSSELYSTNSQSFMQNGPSPFNFERLEPLVEIPSPTRGMRKPVPTRFHTTPTNPFNDIRPASNAGYIHPIDEEEEEEEIFPARNHEESADFAVRMGAKKTVTITTPTLHSMLDPGSHQDRSVVPRRASIRSYPKSPQRRNGERQALNAFDSSSSDIEQHSNGRGSPDKSDRTISSLSEQSQRSNWSATSSMRDIGGATIRLLTRSISGGSSAVQSSVTDPFLTPRSSPTEKKIIGVNTNVRERFTGTHGSAASSAIQSNTSQGEAAIATGSGFSRLQAEGEALLGGASRLDEMLNDFERINERVAEDDDCQLPDTPRKDRVGWIGSVRRALARTTSGGNSSRVATFLSGRNSQLANRQPPADETFDVPYSDEVVANIPRRAVSDGGFWRGRRGAKDWADESDIGDLLGRRSGDDWGGPDDTRKRRNSLIPVTMGTADLHDGDSVEGDDWDVEAAAERRVVQVSFTVPRTRLRVVNVDADKGSLVSADDRKVSEGLRQS